MASTHEQTVSVGGHTIKLSNLDKVLYPETGTTKAEVIDYYVTIAPELLRYSSDRPATRKRWVHGVGTEEEPGAVFFQKDLGDSAPGWLTRATIQHSDHTNVYPLVNDVATLTWLGQIAALEIHVPQWRFDAAGTPRNPDRFVLDLDPGEGVTLAECAEVAVLARAILRDMGLDPYPVTSGSKGIHLYAALDGTQSSDAVTEVAHELARALEAEHPQSIVSSMSRALRPGKVFIDWSQNRQSKTTIAPYSLRGKSRPMVAAPRTWRELRSKSLRQLDYRETLERVKSRGDPLAPVADTHGAASGGHDRLRQYRERRDASKTPEPVPDAVGTSSGTEFVIHEHHARQHHLDFRLERHGVLVSWALPRGLPDDPAHNRLAVHTEDHPMEYGRFEGVIPRGEYGAGTVRIWDAGTYELEKWRDDEIIVTLHGRPDGGLGAPSRFALIRTSAGPNSGVDGASQKESWLLHRMKSSTPFSWRTHRVPAGDRAAVSDSLPSESAATNEPTLDLKLAPMLATADKPGSLNSLGSRDNEQEWAFEMKWDGIRALAVIDTQAGTATLTSRASNDLTASYPDLVAALQQSVAALRNAVIDGEIIAPDAAGRPSFGRLQARMGLTAPREVERAARTVAVQFIAFDLLGFDGRSLLESDYDERRQLLESRVLPNQKVHIPPAFTAGLTEAMEFSRAHGLEGVVAKRRSSTYRSGTRSRDWLKVKHHLAQEVIIGGWRPGKGNREGTIGSLLLGVPTEAGLKYVGRVGSGFSDAALRTAVKRLESHARASSPFIEAPSEVAREAHWVAPDLVGEVEFAEWTADGRLRHPIWRGWRLDKSPADVVVEMPELERHG